MNAYHFGNYLVTLFRVVNVVNVVEFLRNLPIIANLGNLELTHNPEAKNGLLNLNVWVIFIFVFLEK